MANPVYHADHRIRPKPVIISTPDQSTAAVASDMICAEFCPSAHRATGMLEEAINTGTAMAISSDTGLQHLKGWRKPSE